VVLLCREKLASVPRAKGVKQGLVTSVIYEKIMFLLYIIGFH